MKAGKNVLRLNEPVARMLTTDRTAKCKCFSYIKCFGIIVNDWRVRDRTQNCTDERQHSFFLIFVFRNDYLQFTGRINTQVCDNTAMIACFLL